MPVVFDSPAASKGKVTFDAPPKGKIVFDEPAPATQPLREIPQLRAYEEPGMMSRAYTSLRETLSPLIGNTPNQALRKEAQNEAFREQFPQIAEVAEFRPNLVEREGFMPAMFTPNAPWELPTWTPDTAPSPATAPLQLAAGIYNPVAGVVNSAIASPGGMLTLPIAPALAATRGVGPLLSGGFGADMARQTIESVPGTLATLRDPEANLQEKTEATAGLAVSSALSVLGARQAIKEAREMRPADATRRLREEAVITPDKETAASLEALAADIEKQAADQQKAMDDARKLQEKAAAEQERAVADQQKAQAEALKPPEMPKSAQILAEPTAKPPALANVATEIATQTKDSPYALQEKLNQMTAVPKAVEPAPVAPAIPEPVAAGRPPVETDAAKIRAGRAEYDRLQAELRKIGFDKMGTDEFNAVWQKSEDVKNRHGGLPPEVKSAEPAPVAELFPQGLSEAQQIAASAPPFEAPPPPRPISATKAAAAVRAQRAGLITGTALDLWADSTIAKIKKEGRQYSGFDAEYGTAATIKLLSQLENGAVDFAVWSADQIKQFGKEIEPRLRSIWDEANRRFKTPPEVPIYKREDIGPNSATGYDRDIPTITDQRRRDYGKSLADFAERTNDWDSAYDHLLNRVNEEYRPIAAGVLAERAGKIADPALREALVRRFSLAALDSLSQSAQALQSGKALGEIIEPLTPYMAWLGLVRTRLGRLAEQKGVVDVAPKVKKGLKQAGDVATEAAGDAASGKAPAKISDLNRITEEVAVPPSVDPALGERIMSMVRQSAGYRDFFAKKGVTGISKRFYDVLSARKPEGNVWTFDSIVSSEVATILSEKMAEAGLTPPKNKGISTAERIAQFLSEDPLRADKVKLIDEAVRAEIAKRPEAEARILSEAWEASVGALTESPSSIATARSIIQEAIKDAGVKWSEVLKTNTGVAQLRAKVIASVEAKIRAVGQGAEKLDLTQFNDAAGKVFDDIAAVRRATYEKGKKLADDRAKAAANPEAEAARIVNQFAKIQSDTQSWPSSANKPVQKLTSEYIKGAIDRDGFLAATDKLGIKRAVSETLESIVTTEKNRRSLWKAIADSEKLSDSLSRHDALVGPLRKIATQTGLDWKAVFTDLPESQAARKAELFNRLSQDPKLAAVSEATKRKLADAAERAWESIRNDVFRQEFSKLVELPNITKETATQIESTMPELIKQANLGLLDNDAFLSALGKQYGIEGLDSATAKKLRDLGEEAMRTPRGVERNRVFQKIEDTILHTRGINWPGFTRDWWYRNVMSAPRTFMEIGVGGVIQGSFRTIETAIDTAFAYGRPDLAWKMISIFAKDMSIGVKSAADIIKTGDRTSLPRYEKQFLESMERLRKGKSPGGEIESLYRRGGPLTKAALAGPEFIGRGLIGADYIGGQAIRQQQMIYSALVNKDMASLNAAIRVFNKDATAAALKQAKEELPAGRPVQIKQRQREILNEGISKEIKEFGDKMVEVTALNATPAGMSGQLYKGLNSIPFFDVAKFPAGAAFLKAALNLFQRSTDYYPVLGQINRARSKIPETGTFGWLSLKGMNPAQIRQQQVSQYIGLAALATTAAYFLNGEREDVEISGPWLTLNPEQQRQLRNSGEAPLSIKSPWTGGKWVSYKNTPLYSVLATTGHWRDQQRFNGKNWDGNSLGMKVANAWLAGLAAIKDLSVASQASEMIGGLLGRDRGAPEADKTLKTLSNTIGSTAAGLIPMSSLLRELDFYDDQQRYSPGKDSPGVDMWLRQVPFVRRTVNQDLDGNAMPNLDFFGNPVKVLVTPFNRHIAPSGKESPAYQAVSQKITQGAFVPVPAPLESVVNASAEMVEATPDQKYFYQKAVRKALENQVSNDLPAFMAAAPEQASLYMQQVMDRASQYVADRLNSGADFDGIVPVDPRLSAALSPEFAQVTALNQAERGTERLQQARSRVTIDEIREARPEDRREVMADAVRENPAAGVRAVKRAISRTENRDALGDATAQLTAPSRAKFYRDQIAGMTPQESRAYLLKEFGDGNLTVDVLRELSK